MGHDSNVTEFDFFIEFLQTYLHNIHPLFYMPLVYYSKILNAYMFLTSSNSFITCNEGQVCGGPNTAILQI